MTPETPPDRRLGGADSSRDPWWSGQDLTEPAPSTPPAPDWLWAPTTPIAPERLQRRSRRTLALKTVLVACAVLVALLLGLASGGLGGLLIMAALVGLVVGVYTGIRGRSETFRVHSRRTAAAVLGASVVSFIVGGATLGAAQPASHKVPSSQSHDAAAPPPTAGSTPTPAARAAPIPSLSHTPAAAPGAGTALAVLATLAVKGRAPMTGYARTADFGAAWLDVNRNGCDTRNDVLRRDLTDVTGAGCRVLSGTLADPYTGRTIDFTRGEQTSMAVQIDHVVALGDAWQTGAQKLTQAERVDLANDPINLFAVDGPTNEQKGDGDAATWLPPNKAFRCTYVAHQVGVKKAYRLWVTPAERDAMQQILQRCPDATAPRSTVSNVVLAVAAPTRTASAGTTGNPTAAGSGTDPRYPYCYVAKAHGAHTPYYRGKDPEYAWYTDRDGDGVVCE